MAQRLFTLIGNDHKKLLARQGVTVPALRLFEQLPTHPMITLPRTIELLETTKPTASKAIATLVEAKILSETTGKARDRVYAYDAYLQALTKDAS